MKWRRFVVCARELSMSEQNRGRRNLRESSYKTPYNGRGFCWSHRSVWEDGIGKRIIVVSYLGNHKFPNNRQLFEQIPETMVGCHMSLKICLLHSYLDILPKKTMETSVLSMMKCFTRMLLPGELESTYAEWILPIHTGGNYTENVSACVKDRLIFHSFYER